MSKRSKIAASDSYGVETYEDAKARLKHQALMQDYQDLEKEVGVIRSKLEAGRQRKMILAAEVRFLRRRYDYFIKMKTMNSSENTKTVHKQTKRVNEFSRKEASQHMLPPIPDAKPKKKKQYTGKEVATIGSSPVNQPQRKRLHGGKEATQQSITPFSDVHHKGRVDTKKKTLVRHTTPVLDLNKKERLHTNDSVLRNASIPFDLNQDNSPSGKEASLPSRAPIFDLNEISTGDEDYQSSIDVSKLEEGRRSLMRHPNDEAQNDLMLSLCRNAGEGPSRVGKRKISWQDPVALRV